MIASPLFYLNCMECPICLDVYKEPKVLPCQHTYCLACLEQLYDKEEKTIRCPQCRREYDSIDDVRSFPSNIWLQNLLNAQRVSAVCPYCLKKGEISVCKHCDQLFCFPCRKEHLDDIKQKLEKDLNNVTNLYDSILEGEENVVQYTEDLRQLITTYFNELIEFFTKLISIKQKTLFDTIDLYEASIQQACEVKRNVFGQRIEVITSNLLSSDEMTLDDIKSFEDEVKALSEEMLVFKRFNTFETVLRFEKMDEVKKGLKELLNFNFDENCTNIQVTRLGGATKHTCGDDMVHLTVCKPLSPPKSYEFLKNSMVKDVRECIEHEESAPNFSLLVRNSEGKVLDENDPVVDNGTYVVSFTDSALND